MVLIKDADGEHWSIDRNKVNITSDFREDKEGLVALVRNIINLQAAGFIDEHRELSHPKITIKVGLADGERVLSLYSADQQGRYLAKKSQEDQIYEIAQGVIDRIVKPIEELRDMSVLKFDKSHVAKITIRAAKELVILTKKDNWTIAEPEKLPNDFEFDPTSVSDLLSSLSALHGQRLARAQKDVAVNSQWQKDWLVELVSEKGEPIHVFADKIKASKDEYLVKGNIDGNTYVVNAAKIGQLFLGLKAFKKEEFELPPIEENTRGFESLPVDVQRKLLEATKNKKK